MNHAEKDARIAELQEALDVMTDSRVRAGHLNEKAWEQIDFLKEALDLERRRVNHLIKPKAPAPVAKPRRMPTGGQAWAAAAEDESPPIPEINPDGTFEIPEPLQKELRRKQPFGI